MATYLEMYHVLNQRFQELYPMAHSWTPPLTCRVMRSGLAQLEKSEIMAMQGRVGVGSHNLLYLMVVSGK